MSHWTVLKVKLSNPNPGILKTALDVIARELGSHVVEDYTVTGFGFSERCNYAIPLNLRYGNGYGVKITSTGEVLVVVDDHGAPLSASDFANKLTQYYLSLIHI